MFPIVITLAKLPANIDGYLAHLPRQSVLLVNEALNDERRNAVISDILDEAFLRAA